jgi:transcriptional regulator with XRE-family HTH domain
MVESFGSSDLGRRVARRRTALGLTREDLANRTGIDVGYLEYLETTPAAGFDTAGLLKLADGLETTADVLLGGGIDRPSGGGQPGEAPRLERLDERECLELLRPGGIGRVVFDAEQGPVALPVNFRMLTGDIVFRTSEEGVVGDAAKGHEVGFEVDHIDDAQREGWSVLLSGRPHRVVEPHELSDVQQTQVEPWAGGQRDVYIRLVPTRISGRRIRVQRGAQP